MHKNATVQPSTVPQYVSLLFIFVSETAAGDMGRFSCHPLVFVEIRNGQKQERSYKKVIQ